MESLTYSQARASLARTLDRVNDDRNPVLITRQRGRSAVLMSLDDYNSLIETAYVLRSPANARRLQASLAEARAGKARKRALIR